MELWTPSNVKAWAIQEANLSPDQADILFKNDVTEATLTDGWQPKIVAKLRAEGLTADSENLIKRKLGLFRRARRAVEAIQSQGK